jgi:hypothetical protein
MAQGTGLEGPRAGITEDMKISTEGHHREQNENVWIHTGERVGGKEKGQREKKKEKRERGVERLFLTLEGGKELEPAHFAVGCVQAELPRRPS